MLIATAEAGAPERTAPADLRASLSRVAARLHHAAELAEASHDGTAPEWGAELVLTVLDALAPDLAVLAAARASITPA